MSNKYSVSLYDDSKKSIDFYKSTQGIADNRTSNEPIDFKIDEMIKGFCHMIQYTNTELNDYFTQQEAFCIVASRTGSMYNTLFSPKRSLYINVSFSIEYEDYDVNYHVDPKIILDKIERLTEFQAFCVIQMCQNYLLDSDSHFDIERKCLKHIFLISDEKVE